MQGILHEEPSFGLFLLVTVLMGGAAAWLTGRAVADQWRGWAALLPYGLMLAAAVRFIHFALFGGTLLSLHYYAVDAAVVLAIAAIGYRTRRARRMAAQYPWIGNAPSR